MPAGKGKKGGKGKKAVASATSPLANSVLRHLPPEVLGEIVFHLHGFQASDKFAGARAGRVFKVGDLGLGYYVDDRKSAVSDLHGFKASDKFAGATRGPRVQDGRPGAWLLRGRQEARRRHLLALAATCTDMRAAVLPALLPLAKLKLRFAMRSSWRTHRRLCGRPRFRRQMHSRNAPARARWGERARREVRPCGRRRHPRAVGDASRGKSRTVTS